MSDTTDLVPTSDLNPIGLDSTILSKLETYEDYLSYYQQIDEAAGAFTWLKADTLAQMAKTMGDKSLEQLGKDIREKKSTVSNYVRTARAFPMDKREPAVSFSTHFQASFADSFNDKQGEFQGEKRFEWIKKAAEQNLSSNQVYRGIQEAKVKALENGKPEEAWKFDAMNKAAEIRSLVEGLIAGVKNDDKAAYDKLKNVYERVYAQN